MDRTNQTKVETWVAKHKPVCPACGGAAWGVCDLTITRVVETPIPAPSIPVRGVGTAFQVPIICENCGCFLHVSAVILGVVPVPGSTPPG
jgi:hypothetical protein